MFAIIGGILWLRARGERLGRGLHQDEAGQDLMEYVLILASVGIVLALIIIAGFEVITEGILRTLCPTVDPLGDGECIG